MPRTLKDHLQADIAESERKAAKNPDLYRGGDWWQLSDEEEEVFRIDRDRFPRMVTAWHCYEAFKGIVSEGFPDDLIEQGRQQHPEWCGTASGEKEFPISPRSTQGCLSARPMRFMRNMIFGASAPASCATTTRRSRALQARTVRLSQVSHRLLQF